VLRLDLAGDVYAGSAGRFHAGPCADGNAGEQRSAERATLVGRKQFDGVAVDVGLDLLPERAARAAAAEADAGDRDLRSENKENVSRREKATPSMTRGHNGREYATR